MAAAVALTGFGQSPSAPPPSNSLLTPIRPPTEDSNQSNNDGDDLKRNINFDDEGEDGQGDAKRHKLDDQYRGTYNEESVRAVNNENNHFNSPGQSMQQNDQAPDISGTDGGPTEVAYV